MGEDVLERGNIHTESPPLQGVASCGISDVHDPKFVDT